MKNTIPRIDNVQFVQNIMTKLKELADLYDEDEEGLVNKGMSDGDISCTFWGGSTYGKNVVYGQIKEILESEKE